MEHQHPLAEPVGAYFKAGFVTGKGIQTRGPGNRFVDSVSRMLAVVKQQLEVKALNTFTISVTRGFVGAIFDPLQIAVGKAAIVLAALPLG